MQDPLIAKAIEELEVLSQDPTARALYDARKKYWMDYISLMNYAKTEGRQVGLKEGHQEGLQEGRQVGIQEGRQVGIQEGRQVGIQEGRRETQQEIAKSLKQLEISNDAIVKATGLSLEEIEKL